MGQRLYLIKNDKYRLDIEAFNTEFRQIKSGRSKYNYRFSIKEKFSEGALESYDGNVIVRDRTGDVIGFDLKSQLDYGTYLYLIEKIDVKGEPVEELAYGFIEILPDFPL